MKKEEFAARFRAEMADVHVSPRLRRAVLDAQEGKERPVMKKKWSVILVLVVAVSLLTAAAIAVVSRAGILDFAGRWFGVYVPKDAQDHVQTDIVAVENELAVVQVREMYYDGLAARIVVDVHPKDSAALLMFDAPNAALQTFNAENGKWNETSGPTAIDVYEAGAYQAAYAVEGVLSTLDASEPGAVSNYSLNDNGSLTCYYQLIHTQSRQQREAVFTLSFTPYTLPLSSQSELMTEQQTVMEIPFTLRQTNTSAKTYISTESVVFEEAGVRVDSLRLEECALEIHAVIEYTVIDQETFESFEHGVWFDFVDPNTDTKQSAAQRLAEGLRNSSSLSGLGDDRYRLTQSIGKNELHESYTLRAYEIISHSSLGTNTLTVVPADE